MHTAQLGGVLGAFIDPATQQPVSPRVFGTMTYQYGGDPAAVAGQLQAAVLNAAKQVVGQKLVQNQVALQTLAMSMPHFVPEIIASSGVAQWGVQITHLDLQVQVDMPAPGGFPPGALPPDPHSQMQNRMNEIAAERLDPTNYEYEARINVGGFKINASTDGGLDTDGLANQVKEKAKSQVIWWGIGCFITFLVVAGLCGLGYYIYLEVDKSTASTSSDKGKSGDDDEDGTEAETVEWDGKEPFSCGGSKKIKIEGVKAKINKGTAITAQANCELELEDVDIVADVGIQTGANAVVRVKGGSVEGKTAAAKALGKSKIIFDGTKVKGKKEKLGGAKIEGP
jgi:hypothetical protein